MNTAKPQIRTAMLGIVLGLLCHPLTASAGVDDCLKTALNAANPKDLERAAAFASQHPTCLQNLVPPTLVPYLALSGAVDVANKSGALDEVGLGFGNSYTQCKNNLDPGQHAVKQLKPVLQPVCGTLSMNCQMFEGSAADEVNSELTSEVPLLGLMPCACAAATSGLGVERLVELLKTGQQCGATLQELAEALNDTAGAITDAGQALLEGAAGLVSDLGCAVFGCDEEKPLPMPAENFDALYLKPLTHRLLMDKEQDGDAFKQRMSGLNKACQDFYLAHYDTDNGACTGNMIKLRNRIDQLYVALQQKGENYYAVYVEPELQNWAFNHFGENSAPWVAKQEAQCRSDAVDAFPMPDPFARCKLLEQVNTQTVSGLLAGSFNELNKKIAQQCQAEQQPYVVNPPDDIYAMACEPVAKKTPVAVLGAMMQWKQRMDKAASAGCTNSGTPASVSCPDFDSFVACRKAVKDAPFLCGGDADVRLAQGVLHVLNAESAKAGKPMRCRIVQDTLQCDRPIKLQQCKTYMAQYGDLIGIAGAQAQCTAGDDSEYTQLRQRAAQVAAVLNGYEPSTAGAAPVARAPDSGILKLQGLLTQSLAQQVHAAAAAQCHVEAPDWLRIRCPSDFIWDSDPARVQKVVALLGAPLALCPNDPEADGADLPCLDGMPVGAFPEQAKPEDKPAELPAINPAVLKIKPIRF